MLTIEVGGIEFFDEETQRFIALPKQTLMLEHSLISLAKWESKWKKPFLDDDVKNEKTAEEMLDYIKCMTINNGVEDVVYNNLSYDDILKIKEYIDDPMTATWFTNHREGKGRARAGSKITAEILYYDMIALQIPFECQKWHLNRLLTLIRVCQIKSQPPKKMGRKEAMRQQKAINAARRAQHGTAG